MANPTLEHGDCLVRALFRAALFFDSLTLLLGQIVGVKHGFVAVLLMSHRFFMSLSAKDRIRFAGLVKAWDTPIVSRKRALARLTEGKIDEAFLMALAETEDSSVVARIDAYFPDGRNGMAADLNSGRRPSHSFCTRILKIGAL
jgi:hypothetical protein